MPLLNLHAEPLESRNQPLTARQLVCQRGGRTILDGVDLAAAAGEIVSIRGANGSGKTTLLNCLAGLLKPRSGDVLWFGAAAGRSPRQRRWIGFAGHEAGLYQELTAGENLRFAARMHGLSDPEVQAEELLRRIGLRHCGEQPTCRFSRGMQQRLSLARALIHAPAIVVLDEPFANVDADGRRWLEEWLSAQRAEGRAILFTSHDDAQCRRLADRRLELVEGRLFDVAESGSVPLARSA